MQAGNGGKNKKKIKSERYKTELCKNFEETGKCNYGKKCEFAHGKMELKEKPKTLNNPRYKSTACSMFFDDGYCPYGRRCIFKHDERESIKIKSSYYYQFLLTRMKETSQIYSCRMTSRINDWMNPSSSPDTLSEESDTCY